MHNKDKAIFDKKLPYEYNICLYILEELCDKGVIDVFEMTEAIILLRKKYKMPVIDIYGKRSLLPCFFSGSNYFSNSSRLLISVSMKWALLNRS